jgi:glucosamine-6-phosphate deaminase
MGSPGPNLVVCASARAVTDRLLQEFASAVRRQPALLVSLATGATYHSFFLGLDAMARTMDPDLSRVRFTHLDEFLGFGPDDPGGFVGELLGCPALGLAFAQGRFHPVPSSGEPDSLRAHEARIAELGAVDLQFLGLGGNGHIGFCEPGTDPELGFHRSLLAPQTRAALAGRFASAAVPDQAITAGPRSILAARRIVLAATGSGKAAAVRDMIDGPVDPACPASLLRSHPCSPRTP